MMETAGLKIGVVTSKFNGDVTEKLEAGARECLQKNGLSEKNISFVKVPGAFEIPIAVQAFLESDFDGVVALGAVIRGETSHYDYVCNSVERGCSELQLKFKKPVGFGILTTENEEQAMARAGGAHGNKGFEAAEVVIEMVNLIRNIKGDQT